MDKGANVALSALTDETGSVLALLEWRPPEGVPVDADIGVLLLGDDGKVRSSDDFIFFNQPSGADGSVRLRGKANIEDEQVVSDAVEVDLDGLPDLQLAFRLERRR